MLSLAIVFLRDYCVCSVAPSACLQPHISQGIEYVDHKPKGFSYFSFGPICHFGITLQLTTARDARIKGIGNESNCLYPSVHKAAHARADRPCHRNYPLEAVQCIRTRLHFTATPAYAPRNRSSFAAAIEPIHRSGRILARPMSTSTGGMRPLAEFEYQTRAIKSQSHRSHRPTNG